MIYSFDHNIAVMYGVDEAIMINNFSFWISHNRANENHFYEGRYWTYNSKAAFSKIFIFWSEKQIRRILESLISQGVLMTGNFNKRKMDRTIWYSFTDASDYLGMSPKTKQSNDISPNGPSQSDQMGRAIPDSKLYTDSKPNNKPTDKSNVDSDKSSSFAFKKIVEFWLKEFHKGWIFDPVTGKSLKLLITKIKKVLVAHGRLAGDQEVIDFFMKMCQSLPDHYQQKDMAYLNHKFNELITEISNARTKERSRYGGDSVYRN